MAEEFDRRCQFSLSFVRDGRILGDLIQNFCFEDMKKELILGRLEIIVAMHKACGCDYSNNHYSTKKKCYSCSAINRWAAKGLSTKGVLRISRENGETSLQARGSYVTISTADQVMNSKDGDWGMKLQLERHHDIAILPRTGRASDHKAVPLRLRIFFAPIPKRPVSMMSQNDTVSVFFVPLGREMPSSRRELIRKQAERLNMTVVVDIRLSSHIVISSDIQNLKDVAIASKIDEEDLRTFVEENETKCVLPRWITASKGAKPRKPNMEDIWLGNWSSKRRSARHSASEINPRANTFETNRKISELFRDLSNLQQACPLLEGDNWKAYSYRITSGRLMHLDFEISNDGETFDRLRHVSGIGKSTVDKIKEYFERGTFNRIEEFRVDPQRIAMKNMMGIWGVGEKTARDLVQVHGFSTIADIRRAVEKGMISLDRNQLVGVDRYEDILEEMDREEVVMIADYIKTAVDRILPGAELQVMGSFRRGKKTCGDVDIHITHKKYKVEIPKNWCSLSKIIDLLWEQDRVMYHLTFLPGMKTGSSVGDYLKSSQHIPENVWGPAKGAGYLSSKRSRGSSYMGVFKSPKIKGKGRRVDIKFFPWSERIFASLYFTGNGYFNRSMRLWAARKFGFTLNEHGLFKTGTSHRVMEANNEREVFDKLKLIYKEPHERDCFDAVIPKSNELSVMSFELADNEKHVESLHVWVK